MSKSRLEKFLYALYSLDSSDLSNPLSRIEELYKCLVTGEEAPTFEPISRTEKYLMAILGVYDVNELPNPISRVEVLLYKLATGDDNLDDIKSFLSEHEELLAEIIRNGGVGGNIDIEYVLYTLSTEFNTLYNTAEKPVKSAILKGQTLVNLFKKSVDIKEMFPNYQRASFTTLNGEEVIKIYGNNRNRIKLISTPKTSFTIKMRCSLTSESGSAIQIVTFFKDGSYVLSERKLTTNVDELTEVIYSYSGDKEIDYISFDTSGGYSAYLDVNNLVIIEGDYTNVDIPYFEGMQSVKMPVLTTTGKNLFDMKNSNFITEKDGNYYSSSNDRLFDTYTLLPNTAYTISGIFDSWGKCFINGVNLGNFGSPGRRVEKKFTTDSTGMTTIFFGANNAMDASKPCYDFQLEIGDAFTSYDPYKSNILTVNEDVTLRSNGDVYDELNLLTGRLTQRIGENNEVLAQVVVKTVDLSVVDQDGNDTKLSTFNDITHVTLSSEGLVREAELEVATKNEEVLNTMSLEMDDISTTQNALKETSNTQSENVDATMIATTEIYEELL